MSCPFSPACTSTRAKSPIVVEPRLTSKVANIRFKRRTRARRRLLSLMIDGDQRSRRQPLPVAGLRPPLTAARRGAVHLGAPGLAEHFQDDSVDRRHVRSRSSLLQAEACDRVSAGSTRGDDTRAITSAIVGLASAPSRLARVAPTTSGLTALTAPPGSPGPALA